MHALEIKALSHDFDGTVALSNVSFAVEDRELFCVLGPNGSGKSTLFRCLSTLLKPSAGNILITERIDLIKNPARARRLIGTVFQHPALDPMMTVHENLRISAALYSVHGKKAAERIADLAPVLGIDDRLNTRVAKLSGGLKRRVDLLRGLLHDPAILLLDEPTTGLDPSARRNFWDVIDRIRKTNRSTILFTSHLMEEADPADKMMILNRGTIVAMGTADELRKHASGDKILLQSTRQDEIMEWLQARFEVEVQSSPGSLYISSKDPVWITQELQKTWNDAILELTIRKPSLDDIFFERTGSHWRSVDQAAGPDEQNSK